MRAFITGARGFVGPHLAHFLLGNNLEVFGLDHSETPEFDKPLLDGTQLIHGDIRDPEGMRRLLDEVHPDQVYHLAGVTNVAYSFQNPRLTHSVNVDGTLNLLESIRESGQHPRIVLVSSSLVYGSLNWRGAGGFTEFSATHPHSPYAASKIICEQLGRHYAEAFGLDVVTARPFNHIGPYQPRGFVCADFAHQIALICAGKAEPVISVGNLAAERDFSDVTDVVRSYWGLAQQGRPGEIYNVCSGTLRKIADVLSDMCQLADREIQIRIDPGKFRPVEDSYSFGDPKKIFAATGWQCHIPWTETLHNLLNFWNEQVDRQLVSAAVPGND
jgi:GDP-4-dehydro-6-deoxy-D-mannose reductase